VSLTPAQVRTAMIPLIRRLVALGAAISDFNGVAENLGQFTVQTPGGPRPVQMPITLANLVPLDAFVAQAQGLIRTVMTPFEVECGRGFSPRGVLKPGEPGASANDGWV
jgi:hypothetical protein